jgi:hypothetical protein
MTPKSPPRFDLLLLLDVCKGCEAPIHKIITLLLLL